MENLQVNKKYKIKEGEYKDWFLWIEKYNANDEKLLGDEEADYYLIFIQNPQTNTLYDNFAENWVQVLNELNDLKLSL